MIKEIRSHDIHPLGYTIAHRHNHKLTVICCKWYLYWLIRPYYVAKDYKYKFYQWLNVKGIMKTSEGCIMEIYDIPVIKKVMEVIKK